MLNSVGALASEQKKLNLAQRKAEHNTHNKEARKEKMLSFTRKKKAGRKEMLNTTRKARKANKKEC